MSLSFPVIQGQVEIEYVDVIHRSRKALVIEIGTRQKYPEVIGYSSTEMHIISSERTRENSYDHDAAASTVMFPDRCRGWDVLVEITGRYSLRAVLYRPGKRHRDLMEEHSDQWRIDKITKSN